MPPPATHLSASRHGLPPPAPVPLHHLRWRPRWWFQRGPAVFGPRAGANLHGSWLRVPCQPRCAQPARAEVRARTCSSITCEHGGVSKSPMLKQKNEDILGLVFAHLVNLSRCHLKPQPSEVRDSRPEQCPGPRGRRSGQRESGRAEEPRRQKRHPPHPSSSTNLQVKSLMLILLVLSRVRKWAGTKPAVWPSSAAQTIDCGQAVR